jgi:selenide,water dikinase
MKQMPADIIDLVLIGGGHAQIAVLKSFGMRPLDRVRLTLVTDVLMAPYSGMLPGHVEGHHSMEDMHIDLLKLARFAGARLIKRSVANIDFINQNIVLEDGLNLHYDVLSLNSGAVPDAESIQGTDAYGITVKPISHFLEKMPILSELSGDIAVIGGGAAGCELAISLTRHYQLADKPFACHLFSRSKRLLPTAPLSASKIMARALLDNDIALHLGASVQRLTRDGVIGEKGDTIPARHIFVVTAARPADWVKGLAIAHCEDGYIQVRPTLQLMEYDNVFAAGDIASICGEKREKAGVFAVRAGPYLADNLRRFIQASPLKSFRPQSRYLALIGLGGKQALAIRGRFVAKGALWWHLKNWIDKRFIEKFTQIPEMKIPAAPLPALARTLDETIETDGFECSGCGAKAGADILSEALAAACQMARGKGADPRYLPPSGITLDHGTIHLPRDMPQKASLSQSVDFLSQHISDAYLFGRIAALHALSDIFVAGDKPLAAQALVTVQRTRPKMQKSDLTLMLCGAIEELAAHETSLTGGHTTVASEAMLGFSVTAIADEDGACPPLPEGEEIALILTKPIGIGVILAAEMRGLCPAASYEAAIEVMLTSNAGAANIILSHAPFAQMTDVTGFGLARHAMNLMQRTGFSGMMLSLDRIPLISGAAALSARGISSSLYPHNAGNIALNGASMLGEGGRPIIDLLFDPQTSGGVLAALPRQKAEEICRKLHKAGYKQAAIIGHLTHDQAGITLKKTD